MLPLELLTDEQLNELFAEARRRQATRLETLAGVLCSLVSFAVAAEMERRRTASGAAPSHQTAAQRGPDKAA